MLSYKPTKSADRNPKEEAEQRHEISYKPLSLYVGDTAKIDPYNMFNFERLAGAAVIRHAEYEVRHAARRFRRKTYKR